MTHARTFAVRFSTLAMFSLLLAAPAFADDAQNNGQPRWQRDGMGEPGGRMEERREGQPTLAELQQRQQRELQEIELRQQQELKVVEQRHQDQLAEIKLRQANQLKEFQMREAMQQANARK